MDADYTYKISEAAPKLGKRPGELFAILRDAGAIDADNVPAKHLVDKGYLRERARPYLHPTLGLRLRKSTRITPAGIVWLEHLLTEKASTCTNT